MDEALRLSVGQVAHHICDPQNADHYSAFRLHLWRTVIAQDNRTLAMEWDKLDPESLVVAGTALTRAMARREGLREEVQQMVQGLIDSAGATCLRDLLEETGLHESQDEWRTALETQLAHQVRDFVATDAFAEWLGQLLNSED